MTVDAQQVQRETLNAGDFRHFFTEVHGYSPFPWQEALLERVLEHGWPDLIDVPTGLGKTAVLDVALFLSALRSDHARRRVFLVVDRRLIVDQAYEEARKVQQTIESASQGTICHKVRERLTVHGDDEASVLDVTRMRGGLNWSWLWLERPDRHAVVTGTVDQIGSRLLFRGYGVGERLRSIDAALVGADSLIIIDEAHLSDPFFRTVRDVHRLDTGSAGRPPVVVAMSASPENTSAQVHHITEADENHPIARKRLQAAKSLHPVAVTASAGSAASAVADALAYWAKQLGGHGKAIGVVANTVSMARAVFERIRNDIDSQAECVLLTGRVRSIDREYLMDAWYPKIRSGAGRQSDAELYVVATQTIEAGADIDLDGMVTEAASLSATVQRLGRVNRMGERSAAPVVIVRAENLRNLVYGPASDETWQWLADLGPPLTHKAGHSVADLGDGVAVSPAALRERISGIPVPLQELMRGTQPYVPVVSAATLNAWARTSPAPHPDVPVGPYLHGIGAGEPTVSLVWRADVHGDDPVGWVSSAERIPPSAEEAIELPISTARRWLARPLPGRAVGGKVPAEIGTGTSDLESQTLDESAVPVGPLVGAPRRALRYQSADRWEPVSERQVKPGDLLIVPSGWGGCDRYGWNPDSAVPVTDVADFTGGRGRRTTAIRIDPVLFDAVHDLAPHLLDGIEGFISQVRSDIADYSTDDGRYQGLLQDLKDWEKPELPHEWVLSRLAKAGHLSELWDADNDASENGDSKQQVVALFAAPTISWNDDESPAGTSLSHERKPLTLSAHQGAVSRRARQFAENLGIPKSLALAVARAALYHDEGKKDPRFQVMLHGGDQWRARAAAEFLAKSGMDPADRAAHRRAADLSGYPSRMRHEALSAQIAAALLRHKAGDDLDNELVVHLVAAHHGCARPLLPAIVDQDPREVRVPVGNAEPAVFNTADTVDWASPARFGRLCDRYGRWGLALLESIVRLADIWCSARSEECDDHHC